MHSHIYSYLINHSGIGNEVPHSTFLPLPVRPYLPPFSWPHSFLPLIFSMKSFIRCVCTWLPGTTQLRYATRVLSIMERVCAGNTILNLMCRSLTTREGSCVDTIPLNSLLLRVTNLTPDHHHRLSKCVPHSLLAFHDLIFQTCEYHVFPSLHVHVLEISCLQSYKLIVPHFPSKWWTLRMMVNCLVFYACIRVKINDTTKLKELFTTARFARCRSRFVIPVLLYENKV